MLSLDTDQLLMYQTGNHELNLIASFYFSNIWDKVEPSEEISNSLQLRIMISKLVHRK